MNIALVGWGIETKSAYRYFGADHDYLIVSEENVKEAPNSDNVRIQSLTSERKPGLTSNATDLSYLEGLEDYDLVIYTPTARKNLEKVYSSESPIWQKAKSSMHIFFENCPTKNIIGITGTKGKGTTTTLISKFLEANGKTIHIGGNIGIPVLDLLPKINPDDWAVLELSSFQLYKFPYSPHIAVHLMMIPEHIDEWHLTMEDYVESKRNIFAHQTESDFAIYNPENNYVLENVKFSKGTHIPYLKDPGAKIDEDRIIITDTEVISTDKVTLLGKHNLENACAAITAVWQVHQNVSAYQSVLSTFTGLEHRLQLVREISGVKYYDDSFGTTPDTAIVAMESFQQPKIMIVGGHDKGNDFSQMIERLKGNDIKKIICVGPSVRFIADELSKTGLESDKIVQKDDVNNWTMQEIVNTAKESASEGDIVLLSTGSASYGIFNDYKDRGNQYIDVVSHL